MCREYGLWVVLSFIVEGLQGFTRFSPSFEMHRLTAAESATDQPAAM
jgi:hypothetical protein